MDPKSMQKNGLLCLEVLGWSFTYLSCLGTASLDPSEISAGKKPSRLNEQQTLLPEGPETTQRIRVAPKAHTLPQS